MRHFVHFGTPDGFTVDQVSQFPQFLSTNLGAVTNHVPAKRAAVQFARRNFQVQRPDLMRRNIRTSAAPTRHGIALDDAEYWIRTTLHCMEEMRARFRSSKTNYATQPSQRYLSQTNS
ncbi:hypothetical protein RJ55_07333 [Drechmeria coniospora]|nr:hypothetical protein RJ55_07333 [Drechmeria coniospora]